MAHHKDAIKRIRTSQADRARNRANRSRMRNEVSDLRELIDAGNGDGAAAALPKAVSVLQKLARKGVVHKRNAARRISRLTREINALKGAEKKD